MADSHRSSHDHAGDHACQMCPVCLVLGGALTANPEVREHLRAAGRELALALRAALDGTDGGSGDRGDGHGGLRRIDLDDR